MKSQKFARRFAPKFSYTNRMIQKNCQFCFGASCQTIVCGVIQAPTSKLKVPNSKGVRTGASRSLVRWTHKFNSWSYRRFWSAIAQRSKRKHGVRVQRRGQPSGPPNLTICFGAERKKTKASSFGAGAKTRKKSNFAAA